MARSQKYSLPTWVESDFTDHNPLGSKVKLQFHEAANAVMEFYRNVPRILEDSIFNICICDRFADKVASTDTKHDVGFRKNLQQSRK